MNMISLEDFHMKRVIVFIIIALMLLSSCQNNVEKKVSLVGADNSGNHVLIDWNFNKNTET
jgi:hypothetical protein